MAANSLESPQELLASAGTASGPAGPNASSVVPAVSLRDLRCVSPLDAGMNVAELDDEVADFPAEVAALLKEKGLEQQLSTKQKKWQEMKVWSIPGLRAVAYPSSSLCAHRCVPCNGQPSANRLCSKYLTRQNVSSVGGLIAVLGSC